MVRRRSPLPVQVLLFLLVTLLGIATGNLNNSPGALPWGLEFVRRQSLPLAGITILLVIGVMILQNRNERRLAVPAHPDWDSGRSPFPGLEAFTEQDSAVFFSRDAEITDLLDRLHPVIPGQANRLVTVVGPSGAGKSSLVQAGVVPRLRRHRRGWIVVPPVIPGDHPVRSLARSLAAAGSGRSTEEVPAAGFADELRTSAGRPSSPVLVIVDQAEELITLTGPAERDAFLALVASALDADPQLWIIMIMRSEFLTSFLDTEYARLFRDPITVGVLGRAALIEVIAQPARQAGLIFDPPTLPQRMADDAGGGDALPLLAYALQELHLAAGSSKTLTADAYERLGGVTGVLTRQADKVATELGGTDPAGPVLSALLTFVTIGENEPTRRRVPRSALTDSQWRIAEAFLAARLLTSTADGDDITLEVAHEALFRHWTPLKQAIEASADKLRWRADLERWAIDWDTSGRRDSYLLRDERLSTAQHWASSDGDLMNGLPLVATFLKCSGDADHATRQRLSETIARQALGTVYRDPDHSLLLALTAYEECAPTALAVRALTAALAASRLRAVLRGHDDWVFWVAWSPDGERLATASSDRTTRIWDARNGYQLSVLRDHDDRVRGVAWSPDGQQLATASSDRTTRIWDTRNGTEIATLRGHDNEVWAVAWSPDGRRLATASRDRTARIWNIHDSTEIAVLHGHNNEVRAVAWSPDGQRLATASHDQTARIWNIHDSTEVVTLRGHNGWVRAVTWSPDGQRLATTSDDRIIRIWDTNSGNELDVIYGHDDEVQGLAWSPDRQRLATGSNDQTARIWDTHNGSELATLLGHNGWIRTVAWSPDGHQLATGSDDRTARIWDTHATSELTALYGHNGWVRAVAWSPDGQQLATASNDRTIRIWDTDTSTEIAVLQGHHDEVRAVAWSSDGQRLGSASNDRTTRIWNARTGAEIAILHGHDDEVQGLAWSPDGQHIATASRDRTTRIWDVHNSTEIAVLHGHDDEVQGLAWSPDGQHIATASHDRTTRIWDTHNCTEIAVLRGHDSWIRAVEWSPDGRRLATASSDRTTRIWDAHSGYELATLSGHDYEVRAVAWSPDGRQLVTGSNDRTVRIWDAGSGTDIIIGTHAKGVESVSWSPDGKRVASTARDGTCRVWDATITIEALVANAHRRVSRTLTAEERRNLMLPATG